MKKFFALISALMILAAIPACNGMKSSRTGIKEKDRYYDNPSKRHPYPVQRLTTDMK